MEPNVYETELELLRTFERPLDRPLAKIYATFHVNVCDVGSPGDNNIY